jgi:hypothetical protein
MSDDPKNGAGREKQIPPRCARQDDSEGASGGRVRHCGGVRGTTEFCVARMPSPGRKKGAFSRESHSTLPDERNHMQVIQNKQSGWCSLDTLVRAQRSGFFGGIARFTGARGSTQYEQERSRSLVAALLRMTTKRERLRRTAERSYARRAKAGGIFRCARGDSERQRRKATAKGNGKTQRLRRTAEREAGPSSLRSSG